MPAAPSRKDSAAGKLAAEVISDRAAGVASAGIKPIAPDVAAAAAGAEARRPVGVRGNYPIAFGGGQQGVGAECAHP